jgi:diguanylate cyclase (GGDEF)-like protein
VKLYVIAGVAFAAVAALAFASVHFATRTERAAARLGAGAIDGVAAAAEIAVLLERHRRAVEGAIAAGGPSGNRGGGAPSEEIGAAIAKLAAGKEDHLLAGIAAGIPSLVEQGRRAQALASVGGDEAADAAAGYRAVSGRLQDQSALYREERLARASEDVALLVTSVRALTSWVMSGAALAVLLLGPLSFAAVDGLIRRLKRTTDAMRRIADNDTSAAVPSARDPDEIGEMARAVVVFKANAVALKRQQTQVETLNRWLDIALNNMARGLSMFSPKERLVVCNRRYAEMYDLPEHLTRPGTPFAEIIEHASRSAAAQGAEPSSVAIEEWLVQHRRTLAQRSDFTTTHRLADGRVYTIHCQPLEGGGWVDVHEEVTEKLQSAERISELARFDTLTGLANRHYFQEALEEALAEAAGGSGFAILWIDLDRFKEVNDTYGHPSGDALLRIVAERLAGSVRKSDFVARLGGDEFAIIMRGASAGEASAAVLARRLAHVLAEPCCLGGHTVTVGASIGIAVAPQSGATAGELMKNADIALYRAKAEGRGGHVFFSSELERKLTERRRLESELRNAAATRQLALHFQPIVDLRSRQVVSCEALMRWTHPELGAVSPGVFIPLAEETGLIGEIGAWAIREACRTAAQWPDHVAVSVNLSAAQFAGADIVEVTREALSASGLAARRLELEVTETLLLSDEPRTRETLHDLRLLGVSIALDDFGTGYSSLSYLKSFPFDTIKIDQTFVRDLPARADSVAIVRAIADLARTLGMHTVAEGVETAAHLEKVEAAGCDQAQGYYFSRPVPAEQVLPAIEGCGRLAA